MSSCCASCVLDAGVGWTVRRGEAHSPVVTAVAWARIPLAAMIAAAVFWLPNVAWHAVRQSRFGDSWADLLVVSTVPVALPIGVYRALWRRPAWPGPRLLAASGLLGIWSTGSLFISLGQSLAGDSPADEFLLSLQPWIVGIMATYDGSLFALIAVSIVASVAILRGRQGGGAPTQGPESGTSFGPSGKPERN